MDATENPSRGLLNNAFNPPSDDLLEISFRNPFDAAGGTSFPDMDPAVFSMRWADSILFDFDHPLHRESSPLVHADQIFSNGQLVPSSFMKKEASFSPVSISDSVLNRSVSLDSLNTLLTKRRSSTPHSCHCMPHNPTRKSPMKILRKYLNFLIPLYKKVRKLKMISEQGKARRSYGVSSARMSGEFSGIGLVQSNQVFDVGIESSIQDAVLHCKKSIAETRVV
ncbi:hypothetical protein KSP40_PGU020121 [Platanthera guangdongensis]|uniref:Membrane-associated kinase regulator 6 n=1 Tax=Platanthera guangdongensis TaxID=2320717 RepID=A0ABR2LH76_9ASPA